MLSLPNREEGLTQKEGAGRGGLVFGRQETTLEQLRRGKRRLLLVPLKTPKDGMMKEKVSRAREKKNNKESGKLDRFDRFTFVIQGPRGTLKTILE